MANRVLSTLSGVTRFQSGVGDETDLLVRVKEDPAGGWYPVVHTGTYYLGTEEGYLFADRGASGWTETLSGQIRTVVIPNLAQDPTRAGPVRLSRTGTTRPLKRVASPLRAYRTLSLPVTGDLNTALVPGLLVSLVSQPTTGIYLAVAASGDIVDLQDYVYDPAASRLWLRDSAPPSLYATYLVGETDAALLRQEEIVVVDGDGLVRTQLTPVTLAAGLTPLIRKPTPTGTISASGVAVTGNAIAFVSSGAIGSGDVVAVEYYAADSFTAVPSGTSLVVNYLLAASGVLTLEWENGDTWYDTSRLASGSTDAIQLNPLLTPRESGFLYLADADQAWPTPARLSLDTSNRNPLYSPSGHAPVLLAATVLDAEGEPIPAAAVTGTVTGCSGQLTGLFAPSGVTNARGQVLYHFNPLGTGTALFTVTVSGGAVSGTLPFAVHLATDYQSASRWQRGKLLLSLEETPFRDQLFRLSAYYCYPDGAPFQPSGAVAGATPAVQFTSDRSRFYSLAGVPLDNRAVPLDDDSIAQILVEPSPGDRLRAALTAVTGRTVTAAPIAIPEAA